MARLKLNNISKVLSDTKPLFENLCLHVNEGEFVVVFGESGCGKTTLLRIVAGLEQDFSGDVFFDEQSMNFVPAEQRRVGLMFQSASLFPHMTVKQNVAFPLKVAKASHSIDWFNQVVDMVGIVDFLDRYPAQLSGGQQQRVALARCLVQKPALFLLDEPLSNLDRAAKINLRQQIQNLHRELGTTTLFVTHDQEEAMQLADKIVVLGNPKGSGAGTRVLQIDTPDNIFFNPEHQMVAQMFGNPMINLLPALIQDNGSLLLSNGTRISFLWLGKDKLSDAVMNITIGIRADGLRLLERASEQKPNTIHPTAKVVRVEMVNGDYHCYSQLINKMGETQEIVVKHTPSGESAEAIDVPEEGEYWRFEFKAFPLLVFSPAGDLLGKIEPVSIISTRE